MGTGYTRTNSADIQADEVVKSAPINAELNAVLAAFVASTGHSHDGTAAEGGAVTKLLGTAITIGDATAGTDIAVTFDGETNDGVLTWMEDEDYFKFSDDILINTNEKIQFRDTGIHISSNADGDLDIVSDGTAVDSVNIESAGGITLDAGTAGSGIIYEDDGTEMLRVYNSSSNVHIESKVSDKDILIRGNDGGSAVTAVTFDMSAAGLATFGGGVVSTAVGNTLGATSFNDADITNVGNIALDSITADGSTITITGNTTFADGSFDFDIASHDTSNGLKLGGTLVTATAAEINILDGVTSTAAELNILDGVTATAAELNLLDGVTATTAELNYLDVTTLGTSEASKVVTVDSNGDLIVPDSDKFNFGAGKDMEIYHDGTNSYIENKTGTLKIATETSGVPVTIGHSTSEVTVADNLTVAGNLTVTGTTTTVSSQTINVQNAFVFEGATADAHETTLSIVDPTADRTINLPNQSGTLALLAAASNTAITSTPAELNILDGGTSATSTTVADADRVVLNDGGTMVQVAVTDLAAYFDDEITAMPNLITTAATTVGALDSGSITSGFGTINTGSSAITTTGTVNFGSLADGSITVTAFVDEDDMTSNSATLVPTQQSVKAYVDTVSAAANNVTGLNATGTELNAVADGDTSASSITVEDADRIPINDGGTMKQIAVTTLAAYLDDEITAMPNLITTAATTVGALDSGSITSGFGAIDNGTSGIRTNTFTAETSVIPDASGGADLGSTSAEWGDFYIADDKYVQFGSDQNVLMGYDEDGDDSLEIRQNVEGAPLAITFKADQGDDNADQWKLNFADGGTVTFQNKTSGSYATKQTLDTSGNLTITGELDAATLDISGNADIDGTLEADAITINGTAIADIFGAKAGSTSILTTGALDAGSITSGFGAIDIGSSALTTTGSVTLGATSFGDNNITNVGNIALDSLTADGSTITITGNTTFADGSFNFNIASHDGTNGLALGGTVVTSSAAEINLIDGGTSRGTTALANGDGILINDAGTMRMTSVETVKTYMAADSATTGKAIAMAIVFG